MKKVFLALSLVFALTLSTSCSNDSMETVNTENTLKNSNTSANREGDENPYGEDVADLDAIKILSVEEFPISESEEGSVNETLGFKCRVTDHFAGTYTNNHYYHVNCGGTHYVVTYYGFSNTWVSHLETDYDTTIWHGGK